MHLQLFFLSDLYYRKSISRAWHTAFSAGCSSLSTCSVSSDAKAPLAEALARADRPASPIAFLERFKSLTFAKAPLAQASASELELNLSTFKVSSYLNYILIRKTLTTGFTSLMINKKATLQK